MDTNLQPNWNKGEDGLLPCVVQSFETGQVLMLGYMNETAYHMSLQTGLLTFYSRSRQTLWIKGETSGNTLSLTSLSLDCDQDTLLALVMPSGPTCHRQTDTCFDGGLIYGTEEKPQSIKGDSEILARLFNNIELRNAEPLAGSYTCYLLDAGVDKILKKIGEEAAEVIIAAKNTEPDELSAEVADLIYHIWVLLFTKGMNPQNVYQILEERHGKKANLKPPHFKKISI